MIVGKDKRGKNKRAAGLPAALFTLSRSQPLGRLSNRASSGGAGREGRPGRRTFKTNDLVRGDSVGETAQTGIGLSQDTEVRRGGQSTCDGCARNGVVRIRRVGVTVDVAGAGEPGIQVVSVHQRCQVGVLLVLCSGESDFSRADGAQALE